jgi:AcrR family transcriptional regulator
LVTDTFSPIVETGQVPRRYESDVRRDRAASTRRSVVDAAVSAFSELGWSGTTMTSIADRAGVAVETVYRAVPGGKPELLAAAVQAALAGGAARAEVATDDRPGIRRVIDASEPAEALLQYAGTVARTWARVGALLAVLDSAPSVAEIDRLRAELESQRLAGMRRFAEHLDRQSALRDGMSVPIAADVLWTVCGRANHDALVRARGWTREAYIAWVHRSLVGELLRA